MNLYRVVIEETKRTQVLVKARTQEEADELGRLWDTIVDPNVEWESEAVYPVEVQVWRIRANISEE